MENEERLNLAGRLLDLAYAMEAAVLVVRHMSDKLAEPQEPADGAGNLGADTAAGGRPQGRKSGANFTF